MADHFRTYVSAGAPWGAERPPRQMRLLAIADIPTSSFLARVGAVLVAQRANQIPFRTVVPDSPRSHPNGLAQLDRVVSKGMVT